MTATPIPRPPPTDVPEVSHSLMEHSPVPMAELEGEGHVVRYANPAFCRLVGKSKDALVGHPFAETVQEGDGCSIALDRVYRTGEAETHTEPDHPGSHPVYWSYAMWPVLGADQIPVGVMMQVTETTRFHQQAGAMNEALVLSSVLQHELTEAAEKLNEQLKAEIAERKRHEEERGKLAAIVEASDDSIISTDFNSIITTWNRGAERLFGYAADEAIGKSVAILLPKDRLDEEPEMLARIRRGERVEHYETIRQRKHGSFIHVSLTVSPVKNTAGKIVGVSKVARDITERKQHEEHQKMLLNELTHRVKNTLATVQSIATQTMRNSPTIQAFQDAFESRLGALAKTHNLLMQHPSQIVTLRELVAGELSHYSADGDSRYATEGDDVSLQSGQAVPIGMMFHELATNAAKYGALSIPLGRVKISWTVDADTQNLHLQWVETSGPAVKKPSLRGFGSRLIERGLAHELGAKVRLIFDPAGVRCTMDVPLPSAAEMP